jgi:hypothetical protein
MIERYKELNPDFPYDFEYRTFTNDDSSYEHMLEWGLQYGEGQAPDIYVTMDYFNAKYLQGDMSGYAMPYKDLGIDVDGRVKAAEIADFATQFGTRPSDGQLVALPYSFDATVFAYRSSIALDVWGTDDPTAIAARIAPGFTKFLLAAADLKAAGYAITSSDREVWKAVLGGADRGWIVNDRLYIDPAREELFYLAKTLWDEGYTNKTDMWGDSWFVDMSGSGPRQVFGYFAPAWMINYIMTGYCGDTYGDWRVCEPPATYVWGTGSTWLLINKDISDDKKDGVRALIEWITLDTSETGFQYLRANGSLFEGSEIAPDAGYKDVVASLAVMKKSDGRLDILGGQNMFDVFVPTAAIARGDTITQHDDIIDYLFFDQVNAYILGNKTKQQAIADFRQAAIAQFGLAG